MSTQWHPLFARLLRLLLEDFYQVDVEVPVSDLPRKGDLFVLRRTGSAEPPFTGLWLYLSEWNVLEFKGPTDSPQEADLDLLMHVGTGIGYRFNEERRQRREEVVPNRRISLWYLAPTLSEPFLDQARARLHLDYEPGGMWRGRAWGHPISLVGYRDAPVEVDTVPLHLLAPPPAAAPSLAQLLSGRADLLQRYGTLLFSLHPDLWKEVRVMAQSRLGGPKDYRAAIAVADDEDIEAIMQAIGPERAIQAFGAERVIQAIGPERAVQTLGVERAIQTIGAERFIQSLGVERAIETIGLDRVIAAVGLDRVIAAVGPERALEALLSRMTPEQKRQLRERLPSE
jgi:hypothetical protein